MHRLFSTVAVLVLMLCAVAVCVWQTIAIRDAFNENIATALVAFEVLLGAGIVAACASLLRGKISDPKPVRIERGQPLRRIFSAVWS